MRLAATIALIALVAVWAGIVIGVSLMATPVKFQAPSLAMPAALEVGRYTFRLLARVELCLLIAMIAVAGLARPSGAALVMLIVVVLAVVVQRLWLLPALDARVAAILAGKVVTGTSLHRVFAVLECLKSALLIGSAAVESWRLSCGI